MIFVTKFILPCFRKYFPKQTISTSTSNKMRQLSLLTILIGLATTAAFCQKVTLDGYVFEELNRGYLNEVKVTVLEKSGVYIGETLSDLSGHFAFDVEANKEYNVQYEKKIFQRVTDPISTVGKKIE